MSIDAEARVPASGLMRGCMLRMRGEHAVGIYESMRHIKMANNFTLKSPLSEGYSAIHAINRFYA